MATDAPHALIVTPRREADGGTEILPAVERALDERHLVFRTVIARSLEHGVEEALAAAEADEIPVILKAATV